MQKIVNYGFKKNLQVRLSFACGLPKIALEAFLVVKIYDLSMQKEISVRHTVLTSETASEMHFLSISFVTIFSSLVVDPIVGTMYSRV